MQLVIVSFLQLYKEPVMSIDRAPFIGPNGSIQHHGSVGSGFYTKLVLGDDYYRSWADG
jgi:hypothetical protein